MTPKDEMWRYENDKISENCNVYQGLPLSLMQTGRRKKTGDQTVK